FPALSNTSAIAKPQKPQNKRNLNAEAQSRRVVTRITSRCRPVRPWRTPLQKFLKSKLGLGFDYFSFVLEIFAGLVAAANGGVLCVSWSLSLPLNFLCRGSARDVVIPGAGGALFPPAVENIDSVNLTLVLIFIEGRCLEI